MADGAWCACVRGRVVALAFLVVGLVCVFGVGSAAGALPAADLSVQSFAMPTVFSVGEECASDGEYGPGLVCDAFEVTVRNGGSRATAEGVPVVIAESVPAGVTVQGVGLYWSGERVANLSRSYCSQALLRCEFPEALGPDETLRMFVYVKVEPGVRGPLTGTARVSGGGLGEASASAQAMVGPPAGFGWEGFGSLIAGLDGTSDTQAGDHPYEVSAGLEFNTRVRIAPDPGERTIPVVTSVQDVRDVVVDLPVGVLGSAVAAPQCTLAQLGAEGCPADTVVGHITTYPNGEEGSIPTSAADSIDFPLYSMVPEHGVAAEFGFYDFLGGSHVLYGSVVPTPAGYVLRTTTREIPQVQLTGVRATFFGDPAEKDGSGNTPVAFFTNPADCSGEPLVTSIHIDSWQNRGRYNADGSPDFSDPAWVGTTAQSPPVTGCDRLHFDPSLSVQPETTVADSPTGLEVELKVPQTEEPGTLATPPLRDASVTLPAGLTIDPSAAGGLGACTEAQIGLGSALPPSCPESSRIGTVEVSTPALPGTLVGSIYLAAQNENPFHALLAGYIVIDDPTTGVVVKVPGNLTPNPSTGQITGVFDNSPQFPFSDLKLHFFGGARGALATPEGCGTYTTTSDLMPWSAPDSGPDATPSSSFPIASGCVSGFAPMFTAGTENPQAGRFSPFTLSLSRSDGEQNLAGVSVSLPPGLLGKIAGIPLCPDANANAGTCPEASRVGSVQAGAGVGPDPYFVSGRAYLTGPYNGGPYGLVVETPVLAGPFDLGTVVVRQSIRIDPHTAQVTAVSDPLPTILDGIPLRVRRVDVVLDRAGFMFNPTNCTPMAITGVLSSTAGASASVSSRFQVGGCGELPFHPVFTVSTQARTSKHGGASLTVKTTYPKGAQANIKSVGVVLPKQLPSRLTTIQQACTETAFAQNPASCPAGSNIGIATVTTPVLAAPATGPVYLVSHGGAAFPDVVIVFQDEGVTLDLVGSVNIRHGITSSKFASVPDAPISSFQLSLPEGPHSALATVLPAKARGSLCGASLSMPFTITGQNGAVIKQNVKIAVTGCGKAKRVKKRAKGKKKG
jgi:hypothetical protein